MKLTDEMRAAVLREQRAARHPLDPYMGVDVLTHGEAIACVAGYRLGLERAAKACEMLGKEFESWNTCDAAAHIRRSLIEDTNG